MLHPFRRLGFAVTLGLIVASVGFVARGQTPNTRQISVTTEGSAQAPPTTVEIVGRISAKAELAGDAITQYRTSKEEAVAAITQLDIDGLVIQTDAMAIGSANTDDRTSALIRARGGAEPEPPQIRVGEMITIGIADINKIDRQTLAETIVQIVDVAREAGVEFGPDPSARYSSITRQVEQTYTTFAVADTDRLKQTATETAMRQATAKAERLAKLCGGRLGSIRSVQESTTVPNYVYTPLGTRLRTANASATLEDIKLTIRLSVTFELISESTD